MTTGVRNITVRFNGNAAGLTQASRQGGSAMSRFADNARTAMKVAAVGVLAAGAAYAKTAIQIASDTSEALSKTRTVFGQSAKAVEDFAATSAKSHGMSRLEALKYVSAMGAVQVAQGASQKQAAALALQYTELAADMASFSNTSVEEAAAALQASMTGEFEQLKKYGVAINDARLATEAQRIGLEKSGSTWSSAQKQLLSYNLIMADTRVQQGDFTRTADGAANSAKILAAQMNDLQGAIGEKLLPVQLQFLQSMIAAVDWVTANERSIKSWANALGIGLAALAAVWAAVKAYTIIGAVATFVTGGWVTAFWALNAAMAANPIGIVVGLIILLGTAFYVAWKKWSGFRSAVTTGFNAIVAAAGAAVKGIISYVAWWVDVALLGFQKMMEGLAHLPDWLGGGKANDAAQALAGLRADIAATVDNINQNIDRITRTVQIDVNIVVNERTLRDASVVGQAQAAANEATQAKTSSRVAAITRAQEVATRTAAKNARAVAFSLGGGGGGASLGGGGKAPAAKKAKKTGREILDDFLAGMSERFPLAAARVQEFSAGIGSKLGRGLDKVVKAAEKRLAALQSARDATAARIDASTEVLTKARDRLRAYAADVRAAVNATGDLGQIGGTTFDDIRGRLTASLANARDFAATMKALSAAGLSGKALQQLVAAGPGVATATGKAILAGGRAGIAQINRIQTELDKVAAATGAAQADYAYAAGVRQAQGVLDELKSKDAQLKKQMTAAGDALVAAVTKGLRLRLGPAGLSVAGKRAMGGPVAAGRSYLVGESGPELFTPRSSGGITANGALGGDLTVEIHATGPTLDDIVEVKVRAANRATKRAVLAGATRSI